MVFFALDGVLRGFSVATYTEYAFLSRLAGTANPCAALSNTNYEERSSSAKIRISELDTLECHYLVVDGH